MTAASVLPSPTEGEIFCLICSVAAELGLIEQPVWDGRSPALRLERARGGVHVCAAGGTLLASHELVQINKRQKTARPQPLEKPQSRCCQ